MAGLPAAGRAMTDDVAAAREVGVSVQAATRAWGQELARRGLG